MLGAGDSALCTEPVELLLDTPCYVFRGTFCDSGPAQVFIEGLGREPLSADIELSRSVAWPTTVHPLCITVGAGDDQKRVAGEVKNSRRRIQDKAWTSFTSRYLHADGHSAFAGHPASDIVLNRAGQHNNRDSGDRNNAFHAGRGAMGGQAV